ncbi:class I SAM-dependent methyltransferase [Actinomadura bangladeshensis]|uniref:S-adenosyl-L-methionine-dependent methyltransferase n=1 Tax=Actinomadura bangladeshensis TaxID=453573 RepID=A0A4R4NAM8_9ACTN|nr:SAM-dependent methyltransferase [Actinomadura bangladeshensis]TDC06068.1 SAM-dependent methyltransferase [Actinomadura bangladeshensis]
MDEGRPSTTALSAAAARAAHLTADGAPTIFADTVAERLLGGLADEMIGYHRTHGEHIILAGTRAVTTVRARYAEERLGPHGQYAVLGAGLDTYGYRGDPGIRVFEVDHPATQEWKRGLLAAAGIEIPERVALVPADFEADEPVGKLTGAGFDASRTALVSWLGVSFYLTRDAVARTLGEIARLAPGTELVMDYALPDGHRDAEGDAYARIAAQVVGEHAEPYRSHFTPGEIDALLTGRGFEVAANVALRDAVPPETWRRADALRPFDYFRLVRAVVTG